MIARSLLSPFDLHLFNEGTHSHLFDKMGAHVSTEPEGTSFAVWAPNADSVSVIGDFNGWDKTANGLFPREQSGIWEGFIPGVKHGALYKYHVHSRVTRTGADKADPFAAYSEQPPRQASIVWDLSYRWGDEKWMMSSRQAANGRGAPCALAQEAPYTVQVRSIPRASVSSLTARETRAHPSPLGPKPSPGASVTVRSHSTATRAPAAVIVSGSETSLGTVSTWPTANPQSRRQTSTTGVPPP